MSTRDVDGQLALPILEPDHNNQLARRITAGWQTQAACGQLGKTFDTAVATPLETPALETCNGCRVRSSCRATALLNGEQGIWGGTTAADRRRLHDALAAGASVDAVLLKTIRVRTDDEGSAA